ncbi:MAG: hypothetical protein ACRDSF_24940 [Pseudonocardiaceae bacterium]
MCRQPDPDDSCRQLLCPAPESIADAEIFAGPQSDSAALVAGYLADLGVLNVPDLAPDPEARSGTP